MRSIIQPMCVAGIALVLTACASGPSRVEITNTFASQLRQIVSDTKALNADNSRLIDELYDVTYALKTIKKHPLFSHLYGRLVEANARMFVDPSLQNQLIMKILTSASGEEQAILLKIAEIEKEWDHLLSQKAENRKQGAQLNERWRFVTSSVIEKFPYLSGAEQNVLMAIMQERVDEVKKAAHLHERWNQAVKSLTTSLDS